MSTAATGGSYLDPRGVFDLFAGFDRALVVSYLRLVMGNCFTFVEACILQFVYLVLFSHTFFFARYTGLAITILCIPTLFIAMQFTGRADWDTLFRRNGKDSDSWMGHDLES